MNVHLASSLLYSTDLDLYKFQDTLSTGLVNTSLTVSNNGLGVTLAGPGNKASGRIVDSDYIIQGGVVHFIDVALLPDLTLLQSASGHNVTVFPFFS